MLAREFLNGGKGRRLFPRLFCLVAMGADPNRREFAKMRPAVPVAQAAFGACHPVGRASDEFTGGFRIRNPEGAQSQVKREFGIMRFDGSHKEFAVGFCQCRRHLVPVMEIACRFSRKIGDRFKHWQRQKGRIAIGPETDVMTSKEFVPFRCPHLQIVVPARLIFAPNCAQGIYRHITAIIGGERAT